MSIINYKDIENEIIKMVSRKNKSLILL